MSCVPQMKLYFEDFLKEVRLNKEQRDALISAHLELRRRLIEDETLSEIVIDTFLEGSYKRSTAIKPAADEKSDVDVIVVTNIDEKQYSPKETLEIFRPFLEKNYQGLYEQQGRSWGIKFNDADVDMVPTSAPSEASKALLKNLPLALTDDIEAMTAHGSEESDGWKSEPLRIPDRDANVWEDTDPLSQIEWTRKKNELCHGHYVNVVKCIKWWWRSKHPDKKYPKGYPLEHLVGDCCPDGIESVAEGVVKSFKGIVNLGENKPFLKDRGLSDNDVMSRVSQEDYSKFYFVVQDAAITAREAFDADNDYEASKKWRELFGEEFPLAPKPSEKVAFTTRVNKVSTLESARFA